jgi:hypothetical protein
MVVCFSSVFFTHKGILREEIPAIARAGDFLVLLLG